MTITIVVTYKVKDGKMEEAIKDLKKIVPGLRKSAPGLIEFIPYTAKWHKNKNLLIFFIKYENVKASKEFVKLWLKETKKVGFNRLLEPESDEKICDKII
ncbi:MAG: putative quinol monooxygenase [Promethearchaeota archaeon]